MEGKRKVVSSHGSGLRNVQTPPARTDGSKSNWLKWKVLQKIISMDENMKMDEKWLNREQLVKLSPRIQEKKRLNQ